MNNNYNNDHKYYNALNLIPQMGPIRFEKLCDYFNTIKDAWDANSEEYERAGLEKNVVERIIQLKKEISPEKEFEKLAKENIKIVTKEDSSYPKLLKEIHSAPALLYYRGKIKEDKFTIAIVGSRKVSIYGRQVASQLARELSQAGLTIVSGMALGTDGIAHRECLKLGSRTIAVLGSGINTNNIYPSSNYQIAKEIISREGMIVSEYPIGTPPLKQHFPARNRIISGLSLGTIVIEAARSSGTLIIAKFALEQNREVFAVPGNIYSLTSKGSNNLIKLGAKLITKAEDVLEELNLRSTIKIKKTQEIIPENEEEALILKNLFLDKSIHIDQLAKTIKMNVTAVSSLLTLMEIKGKVKNIGGMRYIRAS